MSKSYPSKWVASNKILYSSLHVRREFWYRLYALPFCTIYALYASFAVHLVFVDRWDDIYYVPLVLIAIAHTLLFLGCQWSSKFDAFMTCISVDKIEDAELVLMIPRAHCGKPELVPIEDVGERVYRISYQRQCFTKGPQNDFFEKIRYPIYLPLSTYKYDSECNFSQSMHDFGKNNFDMPSASFWGLFAEHAVAPFFVFQMFCVALWCLDEYWYYSLFTLLMLVLFESTVVAQRLKNMNEFQSMSLPTFDVHVFRNSEWQIVNSDSLLPGDRIALETDGDLTVPCDFLLLSGKCIVNEAMISGESTPMLKEAIIIEDNPNQILDIKDTDRGSVLFSGTKLLQVTNTSSLYLDDDSSTISTSEVLGSETDFSITTNSSTDIKLRDNKKCVGRVLRTGFGTLQGKLVRTMVFSSERMSANNLEAFAFILFLLIFALAAAGYVLYWCWDDSERSRLKLLVECALIITAVVPPELPMELSLAVNNSLMALGKYAIFCMEPFRIPLAGKLDILAFDKTGTLTGENLEVLGVAGISKDPESFSKIFTDLKSIPEITHLISGTCHSLFRLSNTESNSEKNSSKNTKTETKVVGDPMEQTAMSFSGWSLLGGDVCARGRDTAKIIHRFPFSSALKRMSCAVQYIEASSGSKRFIITSKGAPETMSAHLSKIPNGYEKTYRQLATSGARVLALAYKQLDPILLKSMTETSFPLSREEAESGLIFGGFLVFHCPLKPDTAAAIASLRESLHRVVMITGDAALTAIHTAKELKMTRGKPVLLIDSRDSEIVFVHPDTDEVQPQPFNLDSFDYCIIGNALEELHARSNASSNIKISKSNQDKEPKPALLYESILRRVTIFARTSPSQKELILTSYKAAGLTTLMCGDGTNDVGALKQAHVGVALLNGKPEDLNRILNQMREVAIRKAQIGMEKGRLAFQSVAKAGPGSDQRKKAAEERIRLLTEQLEEESTPIVRLGDASVAAPFTSKISTIQAVCNIIKQGRCTLVTTMQMYKILALNSLISAYGLSVLHLEAVRYGDFQATISGMLLASCFLFLAKAEPVKRLAPRRPQPTIANWYVLSSVLLQFLLHLLALSSTVSVSTRWSFRMRLNSSTKFVPGLVNTTVFLVSLIMQLSTFVVNYQGRPFRESLFENAPLRNSLLAVGAVAVVAATETYPEFNAWLELVPMPPAVRTHLLIAMAVDFGGCLLIEHVCHRYLFDGSPKFSEKELF